jgi:hypothetical protein
MPVLLEHDGEYCQFPRDDVPDAAGLLTRALNSDTQFACWGEDVACGQSADRALGQ